MAGHWHDWACDGGCSIWHGLVHGESTTDGSFFARVDAHPPSNNSFWSDCAVYGNSGLSLIASTTTAYGQTCNVWSGGTGVWNERAGWARVASYESGNYAIPAHGHGPH